MPRLLISITRSPLLLNDFPTNRESCRFGSSFALAVPAHTIKAIQDKPKMTRTYAMEKGLPGFVETKGIDGKGFVYGPHARGHRNVKS